MKFTGEQMVFDQMKGSLGDQDVLIKHLERYVYALKYCYNKKVLDAACGSMYGTFLISLSAKEVYAVDMNRDVFEYATKLPFACEVKTDVLNLETDQTPECDVCVSFETIEHLGNSFFLDNLKCKELVFSIPLMNPSQYHKLVFENETEVFEYLHKSKYQVEDYFIQDGRFVVGYAVKI